MRRRQVLAALGASTLAAVAGCHDGPSLTDIVIRNRTDDRRAVSIAVSRSDSGESLLNERMELSPDKRVEYEEAVGDFEVSIRIGVDGMETEETMTWSDPYDAASVLVEIGRDDIELIEQLA